MTNHAPSDYVCPICLGIRGIENEHTLLKQEDLVYKDNVVSVFINSFWVGINEGHVIVVSNEHFENIYEMPDNVGAHIFVAAKKMAIALKEVYRCDGVTIRQNNEPASEQHAFHFHMHVIPRYEDDNFIQKLTEKSRLAEPAERAKFSEKLKQYLA